MKHFCSVGVWAVRAVECPGHREAINVLDFQLMVAFLNADSKSCQSDGYLAPLHSII